MRRLSSGAAPRCRRWCRPGAGPPRCEQVFDTMPGVGELRWKLADEQGTSAAPATLFDLEREGVVDHHVGIGEFRGMEFLHVNAQRIINEVPAASRMPFRFTINAYRGCSHACSYCQVGDTPILLADGRHRPLADVQVGDEIYGTEVRGTYRHYVKTVVLAHWRTMKSAYRIVLADGTELVASGDHRYLTNRGWKHVTGQMAGRGQRPYLTLQNELMGMGQFAPQPEHDLDYRTGYVTGMTRGDGHTGHHDYVRRGLPASVHQFR